MPDILTDQQPKFILANIDGLDIDHITSDTNRRLLPDDEALLKDNYIAHWGPIYVAGKTAQLGANQPQTVRIYIEGPYEIESPNPVTINGLTYRVGEQVQLSQGKYEISSKTAQTLTLRWADLKIPDIAEPKRKLFYGFNPSSLDKG